VKLHPLIRGEGMKREPGKWLGWAREIQALAQTSSYYARSRYEKERAQRLIELAAEIVAEHGRIDPAEARAAFTAQPGYVTPKVDVRGAVFREGKILLVQEALDGGWTLPGGWADVGEPPSLAVEREVQEESGLNVCAEYLVGVYDANRVEGELPLYHAYKLVFLCDHRSGELRTSPETSDVALFPLESLPEPFSPYRTTPRHIADAIARYNNPERATVFD
jgi:ADP-ribose pyrophosphatase YjhB (NUDIX family)